MREEFCSCCMRAKLATELMSEGVGNMELSMEWPLRASPMEEMLPFVAAIGDVEDLFRELSTAAGDPSREEAPPAVLLLLLDEAERGDGDFC